MSILTQKTISKSINIDGTGVHTGEKVKLSILPSEPNTGIVFKRVDLRKNNIVIPNYKNVTDAVLCTTISNEFGTKVSTIEHLMGAFYGLGIDNAIVELNSQENGCSSNHTNGCNKDQTSNHFYGCGMPRIYTPNPPNSDKFIFWSISVFLSS